MQDDNQCKWPDVMFYEIFGQPVPEIGMTVPEDFGLRLEFVLRKMLLQHDAAYIREKYQQGMSYSEIAELHGITEWESMDRIKCVINKLRFPAVAKILFRGVLEGLKIEIERESKRAYNEGYQVGYQDCKEEFLMRDQERKELVEKIRHSLPERVCDLGLSNHASWTLERAGVTKVETLLLLSKPQIKEIRGIGRKTADEIFAKAETFGFPLEDGTTKIYE